jgi:3-methyladenine DNA glycosylase AlkD
MRIQGVRAALKAICDPSRAAKMQEYMKSSMPYHGVPGPLLKQYIRQLAADIQFETPKQWQDTVLHLWRGAKFREERYVAIGLCELKRVDPFQTPEALPMYEEMIVTGAWWDYVDVIASHCVGKLLRGFPKEIGREMRTWSRSEDMWKRRTSILSQLGFKQNTDLRLLYTCIEPSLDSKEFFLRKAIGWALRQYAWTDPAEVRRYVRENEARLSPLSKREALKNIR